MCAIVWGSFRVRYGASSLDCTGASSRAVNPLERSFVQAEANLIEQHQPTRLWFIIRHDRPTPTPYPPPPGEGGHVVNGCGHWTQHQRPKEVNALLVPWLTTLKGRELGCFATCTAGVSDHASARAAAAAHRADRVLGLGQADRQRAGLGRHRCHRDRRRPAGLQWQAGLSNAVEPEVVPVRSSHHGAGAPPCWVPTTASSRQPA